MASGLCAALTGRTHGCTDQPANVKKTLANSEPSTHGTKRTSTSDFGQSRFRSTRSAIGLFRVENVGSQFLSLRQRQGVEHSPTNGRMGQNCRSGGFLD